MHHNNYINIRMLASKIKGRMALWSAIAGLSLFSLLSTNILLHKYLTIPHQKAEAVESAIEALGGGIMLASELGRRCSSEEIEFHAKSQPQINSACPQNLIYMASLVAHNELAESSAAERDRPPVIVRVGCNKGDDLILSMRQWSRNTTYSVAKLYNHQLPFNLSGANGYVCGKIDEEQSDFVQEKLYSTGPPDTVRQVHGFCIEPMVNNVDMLKSTFDTLGYNPPHVSLLQAAVSNYPGTADFPVAHAGKGNLGLHDAATSRENFEVKVITLNDLFQQENIKKIDYLSIDTEGHDMQVILGGIHIFAAHLVRYFEFEYHFMGRWQTSNLQDLIELLDQFGYDCYWALNSGNLTRLTGCWHHDYNEKDWSNIACISRKEIYTNRLMESLTDFMPQSTF